MTRAEKQRHNPAAETRRRGERLQDQSPATEALRHGAWNLIWAVLREIFEESAYERFLLRAGSVPSRESYCAFMREKEAGIAQKPKCC
jgi:hypothetical protein